MDRKFRFAGLDGLRFISIFFVVLHHLLTFKNYFGLYTFSYPVIGRIGYYGIQFFFAGSGFLITYLLLKEWSRDKKINIKYFYTRRVLRIWPGYYALILLGLVLFLHLDFFRIPFLTDEYLSGNYAKANTLYLSFLPHVAPFVAPTAPYVHQTYTIGIEEQFYFICGMLFLFFARYSKSIFIALLVVLPLLNVVFDLYYEGSEPGMNMRKILFSLAFYLKYSKFATFAIGSLLAHAFHSEQKWINVFKLKSTQLIVYAVLIASIFFNLTVPFVNDEYIACLTLSVFCIATFKESSLINYEAKWLSFLGRISYGIYLFHIFAIVLAIKIFKDLFNLQLNGYGSLVVLVLLTTALAVMFGWLSHITVEKFFLRYKEKFRKI